MDQVPMDSQAQRLSETVATDAVVCVVDDDPGSIRRIAEVIQADGLTVRAFASAGEFLREYCPAQPACLILDLRMPQIDGLAVLEQLHARRAMPPTIIVTGAADVESCIRAFRLGIVDFLEKPIDDDELLAAVRKAISLAARRTNRPSGQRLREAMTQLTPRQREILDLMVSGKTIKQIAGIYAISVQAVWRCQRRLLDKFGLENEVQLLQQMFAHGLAQREDGEENR